MHIIHEAIAVVVQAVAGDFAAVGPHIGGQVGMGVVHAGVNHRHHDVPVPARRQTQAVQVSPRLGNVRGRQVPLAGKQRVGIAVGNIPRRAADHVRLGAFHVGVLAELVHQRQDIHLVGAFRPEPAGEVGLPVAAAGDGFGPEGRRGGVREDPVQAGDAVRGEALGQGCHIRQNGGRLGFGRRRRLELHHHAPREVVAPGHEGIGLRLVPGVERRVGVLGDALRRVIAERAVGSGLEASGGTTGGAPIRGPTEKR